MMNGTQIQAEAADGSGKNVVSKYKRQDDLK